MGLRGPSGTFFRSQLCEIPFRWSLVCRYKQNQADLRREAGALSSLRSVHSFSLGKGGGGPLRKSTRKVDLISSRGSAAHSFPSRCLPGSKARKAGKRPRTEAFLLVFLFVLGSGACFLGSPAFWVSAPHLPVSSLPCFLPAPPPPQPVRYTPFSVSRGGVSPKPGDICISPAPPGIHWLGPRPARLVIGGPPGSICMWAVSENLRASAGRAPGRSLWSAFSPAGSGTELRRLALPWPAAPLLSGSLLGSDGRDRRPPREAEGRRRECAAGAPGSRLAERRSADGAGLGLARSFAGDAAAASPDGAPESLEPPSAHTPLPGLVGMGQ